MCILNPVRDRRVNVDNLPSYDTQVSATDETSSVEVTPRAPREEKAEVITPSKQNGSGEGDTIPRLRKYNRQESLTSRPQTKRRNTLTTELGMQLKDGVDEGNVDNDDNKYGAKKGKARKEQEEDADWLHLAIVVLCIIFSFIGIPWIIELAGHPSPY